MEVDDQRSREEWYIFVDSSSFDKNYRASEDRRERLSVFRRATKTRKMTTVSSVTTLAIHLDGGSEQSFEWLNWAITDPMLLASRRRLPSGARHVAEGA